jgi:hypothetical protein
VSKKKKAKAAAENGRPPRRRLSAEESLQRMKEFDKRKESFIAALRKSKDLGFFFRPSLLGFPGASDRLQ